MCVSAACVAKAHAFPCVSTGCVAKTLPLPCGAPELYLPYDWKSEKTDEPNINAVMDVGPCSKYKPTSSSNGPDRLGLPQVINKKYCHCQTGSVRDPTTLTILQHDDPNHLGLWCNVAPCAPNGPNHLGCCVRQVAAIGGYHGFGTTTDCENFLPRTFPPEHPIPRRVFVSTTSSAGCRCWTSCPSVCRCWSRRRRRRRRLSATRT